MAKPKRLKVQEKTESLDDSVVQPKKKKKKNKDKTAGLMISTPTNPKTNRKTETPKMQTPQLNKKKQKLNNSVKRINTVTPASKGKINVAKLKGMISTTITPAKKTNLHSFLSELG